MTTRSWTLFMLNNALLHLTGLISAEWSTRTHCDRTLEWLKARMPRTPPRVTAARSDNNYPCRSWHGVRSNITPSVTFLMAQRAELPLFSVWPSSLGAFTHLINYSWLMRPKGFCFFLPTMQSITLVDIVEEIWFLKMPPFCTFF